MRLKLLRESKIPDAIFGYHDEDCTGASYVGNLNKLLKELPPLDNAQRCRVIEIADRVSVEFARLMARRAKA